MPSPDVVVVGDINVDILARVDHYPSPGGHALAEELRMESGGSAANTAAALGHLGLDVVMLGRIGDDPLAEWALRGLRSSAVDVSHVRRDAEATTGVMFVTVTPDGERTMFGGRGANRRLSPDDIDATAIEQARWLHLSGYALLSESGQAAVRRAVEVARQAGVPISLDAGMGPATLAWRAAVVEVAAVSDLFLPNQAEVELLTGKQTPARAARWLQARGVRTMVVKLGAKGCHVSDGSEEWTTPGFKIDPVDSTGAGDAFDAGFIAGRLAGLSLRASALLANALGALTTTVVGAGGALSGPARVLQFVKEQRDDGRWAEWAGELDLVLGWLARSS
ncbi:MAG: carbohydrate kinase family protein [Anaerolineae bacterium]